MLLKALFPKASRLRDLVELALKESGVEAEDIGEMLQWIKHHLKGFKSEDLPLDQVLPLLLSARLGKVRKLAFHVEDALAEIKGRLDEIAALNSKIDAAHVRVEELEKSLADSSTLAANRLSVLEASLKEGSSLQKLSKRVTEIEGNVTGLSGKVTSLEIAALQLKPGEIAVQLSNQPLSPDASSEEKPQE